MERLGRHTLRPRLVATSSALVALVLGGAALSSAHAAEPPAPAKPAPDPAVTSLERLGASIQRATLDNGMRVVMNVDHTTPTVSVAVTYNVGSSSETPGRSGFAHLFEHMLFQGSKHVKKGEHFTLITQRGGTLNGTTSQDRTNYFEVLPSSELALALWLESDRMRWLNVTPENFENQRAVVQEEYRMRIANAPYMQGMLRLGELVFENYLPYAHPTIGSMEDLQKAKFEWVKEFYETHYAPNNAVLTIAGDFEPDDAMALVRQYFGPAPRKTVPETKFPPAPSNVSAKREKLKDPNVRTPGFFYGYMIPTTRSPEHYALELAAVLLSDGESSRLYRKLVLDTEVAQRVSAWTQDLRGPDEFGIMAVLTEKAKLADVQKLVDQELDRLRKTPPTKEELDKAKRRVRSSFVFGIQTNMGRAVKLGEYETYYGDARLLTRELGHYLDVTPAEVQKAVAAYLTDARRSVVEVEPANAPQAPPKAAAPTAPAASPAAPKPNAPAQKAVTK